MGDSICKLVGANSSQKRRKLAGHIRSVGEEDAFLVDFDPPEVGLQDAFPQCRELDIRDFPITEEHVPYLSCFPNLNMVHVSHLHRTSIPQSLMVQLASLGKALQVHSMAACRYGFREHAGHRATAGGV